MRTKILAAALILLASVAGAQAPTPTPETYSLTPNFTPSVVDTAIDGSRLIGICDTLGYRDAVLPGVKFTSKAITSSTASNDRILTTAHGLVTGQTIVISGHSGSTPAINGAATVTVVDANNFTIGVDITVSGTGGTFTVDCTLGNACLLRGVAGGAACTMAQARAATPPIPAYPHTLAGRTGWLQDFWMNQHTADLTVYATAIRKALRERLKDDTECTGVGTVAGCP